MSKELDGCTFQPQINKSSRRAMTISRYGSFTSPAFREALVPARADLVTAVVYLHTSYSAGTTPPNRRRAYRHGQALWAR